MGRLQKLKEGPAAVSRPKCCSSCFADRQPIAVAKVIQAGEHENPSFQGTLAEYHEGIADRARVPATERHHSELALRLRMEADRLKREAA